MEQQRETDHKHFEGAALSLVQSPNFISLKKFD